MRLHRPERGPETPLPGPPPPPPCTSWARQDSSSASDELEVRKRKRRILLSAVVRVGGFPGGGLGVNCGEDSGELTGRGILLFRDRGLELEDREGASSPCRSEPSSESSSWERSEPDDSGSRVTSEAAMCAARRSDRDGEAVGEGTLLLFPKCVAFFWSSFSLAEPGGAASSKLDGSRIGMRLCLRLGSFRTVTGVYEMGLFGFSCAIGSDFSRSLLSF